MCPVATPTQHENRLASRQPRRGQRRGNLVATTPSWSLTWELSAPRIVAFEHAEQNRAKEGSSAPWPHSPRRRRDGATARAVLWAGRASGHRRGVCARARTERQAAAGGADVRHDRRRAVDLARLVAGARGDARGDGEHGGLLEAGVLRARERLHRPARQRRPYQAGPGAQDRRAGLYLDRATAGAWTAAGQLRAASADSGAPRPD